MIEVVSYPADLMDWDAGSAEQPFYFELYGEGRPRVALDFSQVLPVGQDDGSPQTNAPLPIYEYRWTIGHSGASQLDSLWTKLRDPAARIFLYFPINRGWRVKELVATVKYLTPVPEQEKWLQKVSQLSQEVSPFIADVAAIARMVPTAPFPEVASILSTIAKLQINSVPRVEGFEWSVSKTSYKSSYGLMHGIQWTIPQKMFQQLGARLTGSVAVSFISSLIQQNYSVFDEGKEAAFQQGTLLARAEIYRSDMNEPVSIPLAEQHAKNVVELQIAPRRV